MRVATAVVFVVALSGWTIVGCHCGHEEVQAEQAAHEHGTHEHGHRPNGAGSEPADGQPRCDCGCDCTVTSLAQMGSTKPSRSESFSAPSTGTAVATSGRELECTASLSSAQHTIGPPGCSGVPTYLAVLHLLC